MKIRSKTDPGDYIEFTNTQTNEVVSIDNMLWVLFKRRYRKNLYSLRGEDKLFFECFFSKKETK